MIDLNDEYEIDSKIPDREEIQARYGDTVDFPLWLSTMELDAMRPDCVVEIDAVAWLGPR